MGRVRCKAFAYVSRSSGSLLCTDHVSLRGVLTDGLHAQGYICDIAVSPDDTMIASCSNDRTARLWSVDGVPLRVLVNSAVVNLGKPYLTSHPLATQSDYGDSVFRVRFFCPAGDATQPEQARSPIIVAGPDLPPERSASVGRPRVSSCYLLAASLDGSCRMMNVHDPSFLPVMLLARSSDGRAQVVDSGEPVQFLQITVHPTTAQLVSSHDDGCLRVYSLASAFLSPGSVLSPHTVLREHQGRIAALCQPANECVV